MKWRAIEGKENLFESDEDYTILRDTRHTPPMYLAFKRQYEKARWSGEKRRWAPPIVLGKFDDGEAARAACEQHFNPTTEAA